MTKTPEIDIFIQKSVECGKTFDEIKAVLTEAGWDNARVNATLDHYYAAHYPVAVPRPKTFASPRLFFLNLFYFLLLYLVCYNIISTLFTFLDYYLPDGLGRMQTGFYYASSIEKALQDNLSIFLVCAPLLYFTNRTINRAIQKTKQNIPRIRLYLLYFTMFIGACVLLGNACGFVYYFLTGELSWRFIIKVVILSCSVLGLYLAYRTELAHDEEHA